MRLITQNSVADLKNETNKGLCPHVVIYSWLLAVSFLAEARSLEL